MKILVYPKDANPYQSLLYDAMKKLDPGLRISYAYSFPFIGSLPFFITVAVKRALGYRVIHIHWPSFGTRLPIPANKNLSYFVFMLTLKWIKLLGFRMVWTVHNVIPHEPQTADDLSAMRKLAKAADAKIVHSGYTIQQMTDFGLDTNNTFVIPHGNYIGTYPDNTSAVKARTQLNLGINDFVILFFGQIRPYKGIKELLSAFESINNPNARLIIAGRCSDETMVRKIKALKGKTRIDFYEGRIADKEVGMYFKACNVVCLPFRAITTSGSALLALSFGRPLIAPSEGALLDMPNNIGYLYDPHNPSALSESLNQSINNSSDMMQMGQNAFEYAQTLGWSEIGRKTHVVFAGINGKQT